MKKVLAFDLSSGETGIETAMNAAAKFLTENPEWKIKGFAHEDVKSNHDRLEIVKCTEFLSATDGILEVRRKQDSTLVRTIQSVLDEEADAVVSAAPSGPLVAAGFLMSRAIEGLKPAFTASLAGIDGIQRIILDVGANLDVDSETLNTYAVMGSIYAKALGLSDDPIVRLLNIGSEDKKGTPIQQEAFKLMKENASINFKGNIESNIVFSEPGNNVIVTDAYAGNIMLKSYEGSVDITKEAISKSMSESILDKIGLALSSKFRSRMKMMSNDNAGGAIILGLNHIMVKVHGAARELWLYNALNQTKQLVEKDLVKNIKESFNG